MAHKLNGEDDQDDQYGQDAQDGMVHCLAR